MTKSFLTGLLMSITFFVSAQNIDKIINAKEVEKIEKILSADDMRGRKTFTPDIDKAAAFISNEFKEAGLQTLDNSGTYLQDFSLVQTHFISARAKLDNDTIATQNIVAFTSKPDLYFNEDSGYTKAYIKYKSGLEVNATIFCVAM